MTENMDAPKASEPIIEDRTFLEVLKSLVGRTVTVVNPESYEDAPAGHQIRAGFYRAKLIGLGRDYMIVVAEYARVGREGRKEPVKQYIPIEKIKRISLMKDDRLIHI
jgi:hypothetical protein